MSAPAISTTMETYPMQGETTGISRTRLWTGRTLSGLAALFCLMD
jgi:hypothetical protein